MEGSFCYRHLPLEKGGLGGISSFIFKELTEAVIFILDRCEAIVYCNINRNILMCNRILFDNVPPDRTPLAISGLIDMMTAGNGLRKLMEIICKEY